MAATRIFLDDPFLPHTVGTPCQWLRGRVELPNGIRGMLVANGERREIDGKIEW